MHRLWMYLSQASVEMFGHSLQFRRTAAQKHILPSVRTPPVQTPSHLLYSGFHAVYSHLYSKI